MCSERRLPLLLLWTCFVVVVSCTRVPAPARAQGPVQYDSTIDRAVLEYNLGNFEEAQSLFRQAHELDPSARSWRGLGLCAFELRQYVEAVGELQHALTDTRKPLTDRQRTHAQDLLAQARGFVSTYRLRVTPADAEVLLDGKPVTRDTDTLQLDPGPHSVVVRAKGYEERHAEFRAGAGMNEELSIELTILDRGAQEPDQEVRASPPAQVAAAQHAPRRRRRIWTISLASGAVAAAVLAVALRLDVSSLRDNYNRCVAAGAECHAQKEKGQNVLHGSYISAGIAGALALGAGVAFVLEGRARQAQRVELRVGPSGLLLGGRF